MNGQVRAVSDYFDSYAEKYDKDTVSSEWAGPQKVQSAICSYIGATGAMPVANPRILEIGVGTGLLTKRLRESFSQAMICGTDASPQMRFMSMIRCYADELKIHTLGAELLPYKDESFDLVTSSGVMDYIPNQSEALSEIARVLKPGGLAVHTFYAGHHCKSRFAEEMEAMGRVFRGFDIIKTPESTARQHFATAGLQISAYEEFLAYDHPDKAVSYSVVTGIKLPEIT